jgi:tRNA threonylcarbamoyladenosine biosynthesis protein TsaE
VTPIATGSSVDFISHSAEQTQRIGERLGRLLQPGDLVCLQGDLGSGKTCMAQGIGRGLGVALPITSPTFIIVNEYALPNQAHRLYHIDLYRVDSIAEACATGLEEYFYGDDLCVIEWAERAREILPTERLWITLHYLDESKRRLHFDVSGARYEQLLLEFRQQAFAVQNQQA